MKLSKNLNYNKTSNKKVSLENFISFCIDESIEVSHYGGNLEKVEKRISEIYGFEREPAIRMYSPIFDYIACNIKTRIIDCECTLKYVKWYATEKALSLSGENKKEIIKKIISENKEYFKAIISKFSLNILLQQSS